MKWQKQWERTDEVCQERLQDEWQQIDQKDLGLYQEMQDHHDLDEIITKSDELDLITEHIKDRYTSKM